MADFGCGIDPNPIFLTSKARGEYGTMGLQICVLDIYMYIYVT